ncbi:MAG: hypothetical protein J6R89_05330, partial [Clostridia bacterium]|nr:hypothetical protein [Clostridia bacterium]
VAIPAGVGEAQLATIAEKYAETVFGYSNEGNTGYKHDTIKSNLTGDVLMLAPVTKTEYDELYAAKENLIALYSAFGIDSSVFIEGSTWKNKVEGKANATLYDNHNAIDFALGENGGIAITGVLYGHYNGDLPKNFGIKLSESYMDLSAFTVESVSILEGLEYMKNGEPDPIDNCGDWQNFRFGALSADLWTNKFSNSYHLKLNWRNIPTEGKYWEGKRDDVLRKAYDSYGMYVGFTQSVSMKTEADESKTYSLYYGSTAVPFNGTRGKANISKAQYEATLAAETKKLGSFYMFAGTPGEVYAIRVYDKVLNESERLQNFMVDLLAFYEIDIAKLDVSALAAMGAQHGTMVFTHDETLYAENKEVLQATVDFMTMTVSENVETKVVVKDDASYAAVRFMASIDRAIADKYVVKSYGILITPKAYVDAAGAFTASALEAYLKAEGVENNGSAESRAFLNVVADDFYATSDEAYTIAGGFTNFSIKTKENNPAFAAVAYAVVEVNGKDVVVYGSYNEDACITVKETLTAAREAIYLENAADPRLSVYDEVLAQFN